MHLLGALIKKHANKSFNNKGSTIDDLKWHHNRS